MSQVFLRGAFIAAALWSALFTVSLPSSAQEAAEPARLPSSLFAPNARSFTLQNGMQVVVLPDRRLGVITHMVWYRVGAADEPKGKSGIAHFLEHLMFKGTERFPSGRFSQWLGAIGGQENAFTSWDYTAYFQRTEKAHLAQLMEFEADRMTNLRLTNEVVNPERDVILEERRQVVDNNPASQFAEQLGAALYLNHPYRIPIIGWEHEMRGLTLDDAISFYNRYYTPNNAVLIIAGDVAVEDVKSLAEATYGKVKPRIADKELLRQRPSEPPARAARRVAMSDARIQTPTWTRSYLTPSANTLKDGTIEALDILGEIVGGQTGRLYKRLVVEKQIAANAGAGFSGSGLDYGRFVLSVSPRPGVSFEQIETAIDEVLAEVMEKGVSEDEVSRAVNTSLASAITSQDSMSQVARIFGSNLMEGMSLEELQNWPARISKVRVEQVNAAARKWLDLRSSVTGTLARADGKRS